VNKKTPNTYAFVLIFVCLVQLFAPTYLSATMEYKNWKPNESLLGFIGRHSLPRYIFFNLSPQDKELCDEIVANAPYQILYDLDGKISQVLIPINEELQIHIYKESTTRYTLEIIPIVFDKTIKEIISIKLKWNAYYDIVDKTNNNELADEFMRVFDGVNFKKLTRGDIVNIYFEQEVRLGEYYGTPKIIAASIKGKYFSRYVFKNPKDSKYYNEKARSISSLFFAQPLRGNIRITSKFTKKRWHPILHKYRAHHGVDYGARSGTRIRAIADGVITFKGHMGGYGRVVTIRHSNNYKSLYAHMSRFGSPKKGQFVRQGQIIGYVGNSGMSTGPHLHLGIYKYKRPIDPLKLLRSTHRQLRGKNKREFLAYMKPLKQRLDDNIHNSFLRPTKLLKFKKFYQEDEIKFWIED